MISDGLYSRLGCVSKSMSFLRFGYDLSLLALSLAMSAASLWIYYPNVPVCDWYVVCSRNKTFKPNKSVKNQDEGLEEVENYLNRSLDCGGDLRQAVKLPEGEDINEWLAVNSTFGWPGEQSWSPPVNVEFTANKQILFFHHYRRRFL